VLRTLLPAAERDITWAEFCEWYYAAGVAARAVRDGFKTQNNYFRRICNPDRLADVNEDTLTHFVDTLFAEGMSRDCIRRRVPHFRAGLKWGLDVGLVDPSRFDVVRTPTPLRDSLSPRTAAVNAGRPDFCWRWRQRSVREEAA